MRGGAQSHLMFADDGHYYVVKFQNNPQHIRVLANELIATRIAERQSEESFRASPRVDDAAVCRRVRIKPLGLRSDSVLDRHGPLWYVRSRLNL